MSHLLLVDDNKELLAVLTQLFEESGYIVSGHAKGRSALDAAKAQKPIAAVVDVLLPDMMGYALADQLHAVYPDLPVVFMTGVFKGGKHAAEAKQKHGVGHYFEKPFDAKRLLEAVRALAPVSVAPPPPPEEEDLDIELAIDVEDEPLDAMELTGKIRVTGRGKSEEMRGADLHAVAASGPLPGQKTPADAGGPKVHRASRAGLLGDSLPGLINAFWLSKETGELQVQRGKVKKAVYFEMGSPVFALSNLAADRFGPFLVRVGKIRPEQLNDVAVVAKATSRRTGDVLVERGLLKETERLYYVGQQVKAIIYSLFAWDDGQFVVSFREKARAENIKLDVHPGNLIIRGVKKLYKPERVKRLAPLDAHFWPSQQPAYELHELELEKWEAMLLPKIDGTRTVAELIAIANRPEHQVQGFLAAMLGLSVLERRQT